MQGQETSESSLDAGRIKWIELVSRKVIGITSAKLISLHIDGQPTNQLALDIVTSKSEKCIVPLNMVTRIDYA